MKVVEMCRLIELDTVMYHSNPAFAQRKPGVPYATTPLRAKHVRAFVTLDHSLSM